jgi:site-specific recombinase XerC
VLRYRFLLEQKHLAPSTINVRLAAVRRLAYEAADAGLLSPELAAGIRRVKGAKRLGKRVGNWLTLDQARSLVQRDGECDLDLRETRDRAIIALLLGCGLRRAKCVGLRSRICNSGRTTGSSPIWLEKRSTFGPYQFRFGSRVPYTTGPRQRRSVSAICFGR